ncbi:MAG: hypothetical protein HXY34_06935 [Candidatus Thorarchaeota archaeon]|nr:hypothetical protein [Candidatus Thorarchaeota archaeon]
MMHIKGLDRLREKLPDYPGRRILLFPLGVLLTTCMGYLLLLSVDVLPRLFPGVDVLVAVEPYLPIIGSLTMSVISLRLIARMWTRRASMKALYGPLAYQKVVRNGLAGVALIPSLLLHAATSIRSVPLGSPVNYVTIQWSRSLLPILGVPAEVDVILRVLCFSTIFAIGLLTTLSAFFTFGVDYMVVLYLYFPEESEVQNHEIYSLLRHPAYFSAILYALSVIALRFSIYSLIIALAVCLLVRVHIRREEAELIERFGQSYVDYMGSVPALHVRPRDLRAFFRCLVRGIRQRTAEQAEPSSSEH